MNTANYKTRIVDEKVNQYLRIFGAICIEGPKWCGKTWTSAYHSKSEVYLNDPSQGPGLVNLAQLNPNIVLEGEKPRLIDEWQEAPTLWDAVRFYVDRDGAKGQFILTGSATPVYNAVHHSGAGRIGRIRMRPMSLWEAGNSTGSVSLRTLCFDNVLNPALINLIDVRWLIELVLKGGWPGLQDLPLSDAMEMAKEYLNAVFHHDIYQLDGVRRDALKMQLLLKSLARNECTTATNKILMRDIRIGEDEGIDGKTAADYLDIFNRLFLTDNTPPFATGIRSSVRVKQAEKRHLSDPSLACAILNVSANSLLSDLNTFGFLFESLCERDLQIYADSFGGKLYHYQDYDNREIDAVIELPDQRWCAFEIKLGMNQVDDAAANLLKIKRRFESYENSNPPSVLCVIVGCGNAIYTRPDGVHVVPISALKP